VVTKTSKVSRAAESTSTASRQRNYEMMLVISAQLTEERVNATINSISQLIIGADGTVAEFKQLGKRRLAYPIKHQGEGIYVLAHFKMNSSFSPQLETRLNITEEVLRYLLINQD